MRRPARHEVRRPRVVWPIIYIDLITQIMVFFVILWSLERREAESAQLGSGLGVGIGDQSVRMVDLPGDVLFGSGRAEVGAEGREVFARLFGDPASGLDWLTGPYRAFGERLGAVLFRIPDSAKRDDDKLRRFLGAWPADLPLVVELREPSWQADETIRALADHDAALCITEMPEDDGPPVIRRTSERLYLRLRRHDYTTAELEAWLTRLRPFLDAGDDAFVFFRHDEIGRGAELALELRSLAGLNPPPATPPDRTPPGPRGGR